MVTGKEVVASLRQVLAEMGVINDHSDWSNRLIFFYANRARSAILKARLDDKKSRVSHFNKQTIPCIPMEKIDLNECPCAPPSGCYFTKSVNPIPNPLTRYLEIDNIVGNKDIDYVEWGGFRDRLKSRFSREREDPAWTLRDLGKGNHLYIYNFDQKFATVTSIFEYPLEVFLYPDCSGEIKNKCQQYLDFPLVIEAAYRMLVERNRQEDKLINQSDDTSNAKLPIK
jgi:hypothetical protein